MVADRDKYAQIVQPLMFGNVENKLAKKGEGCFGVVNLSRAVELLCYTSGIPKKAHKKRIEYTYEKEMLENGYVRREGARGPRWMPRLLRRGEA